MNHASLTPVFVGLRTGLHVLVAALLGLVAVSIVVDDVTSPEKAAVLAVAFAGTYVSGRWVARTPQSRRTTAGAAWVSLLTLEWVGLLVLVPEAAYLAFPLFFLYLHVLPNMWGPVAVVAATAVAIVAIAWHSSFSVGGVVGPIVGAGVALLIGLGYRALAREATEREALLRELLLTRDQLAATEREQGMLTERARLAREIHDTVAQGLSSIQLLLHAAERAAPSADAPGLEQIRLARATAAEGLADTRRFIRELSTPALEQGLPTALRRLGEAQASLHGLDVDVSAPAAADLSMDVQTALLRVAQGAVANVVQHANATRVRIDLDVRASDVTLSIVDDGVGFDPTTLRSRTSTDSFGLQAIQERVHQLGGTLQVITQPGDGTELRVSVKKEQP